MNAEIPHNPRTHRLLHGPIMPTLLSLAWPNVLVMLAQASTGLIETWWVAHLGTDALAGMALVFPGVMLMQMISAGAMGGGIASAVARALGGGRREEANALVWHAVIINAAIGACFAVGVLAFGPSLYRAMGGQGASLAAALRYSNVVFAGCVMLWVMNALASVIRGTGNMLVPGMVICAGTAVLIPLSPCLIFGWGPFPALGVAGGGAALLVYYASGASIFAWYILSGRNLARFRRTRPRWPLFREILRVGAVAALTSVQTNLTVGLTTAMVAHAGGSDAVAGYGTAARLEFLLIPLVFGFGGPLVAMVGTNIGAGQKDRALRVALIGGVLSFAMTEAIGLAAALWPNAWLGLFGHDPAMLASGADYLRAVGPAYGFFGVGLALYFASQGAGRLLWPVVAGSGRLIVAVGGGFLVLRATGSLRWMFAAQALALGVYGVTIGVAVASGTWFRGSRARHATRAPDARAVS